MQARWGVNSAWQVIVIFIVFGLTGSTVVYLKKHLFTAIGFTEDTNLWLKTVVYIAFIIPGYQILLLTYGFIFGQWKFFWAKEKRMLQFLRLMKK